MDSQKKILLIDNNLKIANNEIVCDFQTLFQLSPNGIFLFNDEEVLLANNAFLNLIKGNAEASVNLKLKELFENSSFLKIKLWMKRFVRKPRPFNDQILLKDKDGIDLVMNLVISELKNTGNTYHFIGFLFSMQLWNPIINYQLSNKVCNMLKRENIEITDNLEKKITQMIKLNTIENSHQNSSFFTKRENEVLCLSMEGLSIKIIADKLSISSRTVEKYRTKLMEKSGAKNIVEVIVFSLKNNLIKI